MPENSAENGAVSAGSEHPDDRDGRRGAGGGNAKRIADGRSGERNTAGQGENRCDGNVRVGTGAYRRRGG